MVPFARFQFCDDITHNIYLSTMPLFIVMELLPCPPGFIVSGNPSHCLCHPVLTANGIHCMLNHLKGYHSWKSSNIWIKAVDNKLKELLFSKHCSFGYCKPDRKHINLSIPDS